MLSPDHSHLPTAVRCALRRPLLPLLIAVLTLPLILGPPAAREVASAAPDEAKLAPRPNRTVTLPESFSEKARALLADGPIDGIALGLFSQDPAYDYQVLLEEIKATGWDRSDYT